jgi:hypothetical protein
LDCSELPIVVCGLKKMDEGADRAEVAEVEGVFDGAAPKPVNIDFVGSALVVVAGIVL